MTRAVLLATCEGAGALLHSVVADLSAQFDDVWVTIDDAADARTALPVRWQSVRNVVCDLPNVWVTPLVQSPGLAARHDQIAALGARIGPVDLLAVEDTALVPLAERAGYRVRRVCVSDEACPVQAADTRRALVVTRAQPFHRGHFALVEHALARADEVLLVVAAAERAWSAHDPFTAAERLQMVRVSLGALLQRTWLVALPAPMWPASALAQLRFIAPHYDLVVAHNPILRAMALQEGKTTSDLAEPVRVHGELLSGRSIRQKLAREGAGAWLDAAVPEACATLLRDTATLAQRCTLIAAADA